MSTAERPLDHLPDTQATKDLRNMIIHKAGVKDLRYPMTVELGQGVQSTIGIWSLYVGVPSEVKGTHMSRFVECLERLNTSQRPLTSTELIAFEQHMRAHLDHSETGYVSVRFPYFVRKQAPVSKIHSLLDYDVTLTVSSTKTHPGSLRMKVMVPVKSLCPCSKNISDYGAHNQRSHVTIDIEVTQPLALQDLIRIAEEEASSEIFGLLKRSDEKWITERAYENPKFVEDLVRDLALRLAEHNSVGQFIVSAENFESIHNHSAFAEIEGIGKGGR